MLRAVAFIRANRHLCGEYVPDRLEGCESLDVSFVSEYWSKTIRERGRPGAFVRRGDRGGLLTYLFALALTSKSNDDGWTTTRDGLVWARALGMRATTNTDAAARAAAWKTFGRLHDSGFLRRARGEKKSQIKVTLLHEGGSGREYTRPGKEEGRYFQLPHRFWTEKYFDDLGPPTKTPRVLWSADLGFARTDGSVASTARKALEELIGQKVVQHVTGTVELWDPAGAWKALRSVQGNDTGDVVAEVCAYNDAHLADLFTQTDVITTPTTPNPPHGHNGPGGTISVTLTWAFNLSDHPALSLPAGLTHKGEPVGLQLVARAGDERLLLGLAHDRDEWLGQ